MIFIVTFPYNLVNFSQLLYTEDSLISLWFCGEARHKMFTDLRWVNYLAGVLKRNPHIRRLLVLENDGYRTITDWPDDSSRCIFQRMQDIVKCQNSYYEERCWFLYSTRELWCDEIKLVVVKHLREATVAKKVALINEMIKKINSKKIEDNQTSNKGG